MNKNSKIFLGIGGINTAAFDIVTIHPGWQGVETAQQLLLGNRDLAAGKVAPAFDNTVERLRRKCRIFAAQKHAIYG